MQGNILTMECAQGVMQIVPYADNILHFVYYPQNDSSCLTEETDGREKLPLWGIEAVPYKDSRSALTEEEDRILYSLSGAGIEVSRNDAEITFTGAMGEKLTTLLDCRLEPAVVLGEKTFHIRVVFSASEDEKYFGLGQHQDGSLDLGGREQILWHDYSHKGGEIVAVPFLVTNKKYGIIFDNASRMKAVPGVEGHTVWQAEMGEAVSFFLITGEETDDIYRGYRCLCGAAPLPPRRGLGFIQCKQRYASQEELLEVASKYKEKGCPCDIFVVDWFHWKVLGDLSLDTKLWPDSAQMHRELEEMGYETMISCWPRFMK